MIDQINSNRRFNLLLIIHYKKYKLVISFSIHYTMFKVKLIPINWLDHETLNSINLLNLIIRQTGILVNYSSNYTKLM